METSATPISTASPAPATVSAPEIAAPAAPQATFPSYSAPTPSSGGGVWYKEINWLEMGFMFLGGLALWYTIGYYRYKMKEDKTAYTDVHRRLDGVEQKITEATTQAQQAPAQQPFF